MLTLANLRACEIPLPQAQAFLGPLLKVQAERELTTPRRLAAFLAQTAWESQNFTKLEESLYYTDPERLARIFLSKFDLDSNRKLTANEISFASRYTRSTVKAANYVYANRFGNGDEASGDGYRYRGRGLIQLTFKANYLAAEKALGHPYGAQPELLATPEHAAAVAGWYWQSRGLNPLADVEDHSAITEQINGPAKAHLRERVANYKKMLKVFHE